LRQITLGERREAFGGDSWVITINPESVGFSSEDIKPFSLANRIDLISTRTIRLSRPPSSTLLPPPFLPSAGYFMKYRYDLDFSSHRHYDTPLFLAEWLAVFREHPCAFGNLHSGVNFGRLPVDLSVLNTLYIRQASNGYADRLQHILAPNMTTWALGDFQTFAIISSHSLVSLTLCGGRREDYIPETIDITFMDLPDLVTLVKANLPCLKLFHIAIRGVEIGEVGLAARLRPNCLEGGGTINDLRILTDACCVALFNTIRILSPVCIDDAAISIVMGDTQDEIEADSDNQTRHHIRLRE
jgi:hypothetical protein